jgi:NitT/TauT family transport system substrate-binding protein
MPISSGSSGPARSTSGWPTGRASSPRSARPSVRYVATIYAKFPNIVLAKASGPIHTAADLKGRKLGTPGKYGSSWIMLQALLQSAGLTTADVDVQLYPDYGQGTALGQGAVDAATGFANNEPVQLGLAGIPTTVLTVDDIVPLPRNGLIASVRTIGSSTPPWRRSSPPRFGR